MEKFGSGRWLFTVISALVFAYMSVTGKVTGEQAMALITMVVAFYFSMNRTTNGGTDAKV